MALGGKTFYQDLRSWLKAPLHKTNIQPSLESAVAVLPHFCGDPPVDERARRQMSDKHIPNTRQVPPPPPPQGGLRPTVSCHRCRPQESMGVKGARRSMGSKAARRKVLSTLHPNTS